MYNLFSSVWVSYTAYSTDVLGVIVKTKISTYKAPNRFIHHT